MASFSLDIREHIGAFLDGVDEVSRATAIGTFDGIIYGTPADEGRARASWVCTTEKPSSRLPTNKDKDGGATVGKMINVVSSAKGAKVFTLTSNLPYIIPLEFGSYPKDVKNGTRINKVGTRQNPIKPIYEIMTTNGFSRQAPQGMVRINMDKSAALLQKNAQRLLPK